jgi:nucleoside-diphosphate kinase
MYKKVVYAGLALICLLLIALVSRQFFFKRNATMPVLERTFAMIKPDAVAAKHTGDIISAIEQDGFTIVKMRKEQLTKEKAQQFYAVHKAKPFFNELVDFVTSGPVVLMMLERENAIAQWRKLMGATDPVKAEENTLRKKFGTDIGHNAVHGSDAPQTAKEELAIFFS